MKKIILSLIIIIMVTIQYKKEIKGELLYVLHNNETINTIIVFLKKHNIYDQYKHVQTIREEYRLELYQMMKDLHDIMEEAKITYWIEGGTLLGAVRHKGIIPWDDDLDIQMYATDHEKFLVQVVPALKKLGYEYSAFKITSSKTKFKILKGEIPPSCDIFLATEKKGKLDVGDDWKHISVDDLLPLKLYDFGNVTVWGAHNPIPYLDDCYGKTWPNRGVKDLNHSKEEDPSASKMPFVLDGDHFKPGYPLGPLKDNKPLIKEFLQ